VASKGKLVFVASKGNPVLQDYRAATALMVCLVPLAPLAPLVPLDPPVALAPLVSLVALLAALATERLMEYLVRLESRGVTGFPVFPDKMGKMAKSNYKYNNNNFIVS
jgi:hypothetical protein